MINVIREDNEFNSGELYTSYFIGTLAGTRTFYEEDYEENLSQKEILQYETEIEEAIERYNDGMENLAIYYKNPDLKVVSIDIGVKEINGRLFSYTKVTSYEEIREQEDIDDLRDWLTGQYSDGWGEGFEQHPIDSYEDQYEYEEEIYDDEEDSTEYETQYADQRVDVCIHFWHPNMPQLRFERG